MLRLCTVAEIPDNDARGFRSPIGEVIVARQGMAVYGYINSCPHLGIGINFQPNVFMDFTQRVVINESIPIFTPLFAGKLTSCYSYSIN